MSLVMRTMVSLALFSTLAVLSTSDILAEAKPQPLTAGLIVGHFDTCMEGARSSGNGRANVEPLLRIASSISSATTRGRNRRQAQASRDDSHAATLRFASRLNQPKGGIAVTATPSAAQAKRLSSASVVSQSRRCEASGLSQAACDCAAENSRSVFAEKGRKATNALLGKRGISQRRKRRLPEVASTLTTQPLAGGATPRTLVANPWRASCCS